MFIKDLLKIISQVWRGALQPIQVHMVQVTEEEVEQVVEVEEEVEEDEEVVELVEVVIAPVTHPPHSCPAKFVYTLLYLPFLLNKNCFPCKTN